MHLTPLILLYILAGGILPTVLWLWFWRREDIKKPEPRGLIVLSFFAGALAVIPAIYVEGFVRDIIPTAPDALIAGVGIGFTTILIWAVIEELFKYIVAWIVDFHNDHFDEPIDSMIYLIAVALGFACFETLLFITKGISTNGLLAGFSTTTMRFLGATLLHILASATFGGIIALGYCKTVWWKRLYTQLGLFVAIVLHTLFNYFILVGSTKHTFIIFFVLWLGIIGLFLFFEKVKKIVCVSKL